MLWPDGEVKLLSDQVLGSVDVAEACGGHANLEPRFTDAPWKMALFTQAITQTRKIGSCWTFSTATECLVDCYWKSIDFERTTARELFTVDSACNGDLTNNGFSFVAKNAICTEANYSCTCLANQGHLQGFVEPAHGKLSREMYGGPRVVFCRSGRDA